jgi:hypothetical protein
MNLKKILLEDGRRKEVIRTLVRDIIKVYKSEDEGEFYLPNYIDEDKDIYDFPNFQYDFILELILTVDDSIEGFKVDSNFYREDGIITVEIKYSSDNKKQMTYDLVGELNEVLAHEIRHIDQMVKGTYNLDVPEEEDPYKYYTQDHELDAQVFGFKRLSKITKTPFDVVVKRWFQTHKDTHMLDDEQAKDVINKLLNFKK